MNTTYIQLTSYEDKKIFSIIKNTPNNIDLPPLYKKNRISPIFPILYKEGKLPEEKSDFLIGFFCYENVFTVIGNILSMLHADHQPNLWFSHGLASLIVFAKNETELEEVRKIDSEHLKAYEYWRISNSGEVSIEKISKPEQVKINIEEYSVKDFSSLDFYIKSLLNEFIQNIRTAIGLTSLYLPRILDVLKQLCTSINEIIDELIFLQDIKKEASGSFSEETVVFLKENSKCRRKMIYQRTGSLIQLNATLNSFITQAFGGMIPIMDNECQFQNYSLLGIGTAYCALLNFSIFTEKVFNKYPVDTVIKKEFIKPQGAKVHRNIAHHDPQEWACESRFKVDTYLEDVLTESNKFNLVYFDSLLGFRESEYVISAPFQVLISCDTSAWSLMTVTHELVHSHVRAILGAVFSDPQLNNTRIAFEKFVEEYIISLSNEEYIPKNQLESIRSIIANFCYYKRRIDLSCQRGTEETDNDTNPLFKPTISEYRDFISVMYRELNEIIVHIIDYNYFYKCKEEKYLGLLWESWTPVPVVLEDIEQYVLRSILSIGSQLSGTLEERFETACQTAERVLNSLLDKNPTNIVLHEAIECLKKRDECHNLRHKFRPGIYLVDMVQKFLVSAHIHGELYTDENNNPIEENNDYEYTIETGEFKALNIRSPIAFVADRLRRSLEKESCSLSEEYRSTWLLLVCASVTFN